jgi:hypothetical protein
VPNEGWISEFSIHVTRYRHLICHNLHQHLPEEVCRATGPPVLLEPEGLECAGQLTFHLKIRMHPGLITTYAVFHLYSERILLFPKEEEAAVT